MLNQPMVSIIIPIYNCENFIEDTINSVLSQTFTNYEVQLINDCSTDNSINIIRALLDGDPRFLLTSLEKQSGPAIARNKGIELARGRYIAFLDSDDLWLPNKLQMQIDFMTNHGYDFTYTAYTKIDETGASLNQTVHSPLKVDYKKMLRANFIGCSTVIYDSAQLEKITMPNLQKRQDYGLWLKILRVTEYGHGLNKPLVQYRIRTNSVSSNKLELIKYNWLVFRKGENFGHLRSVSCVISNIFYKLFIKH